ncbi:MAG: hypothetical protein WD403_16730, partial [Pirellulales bacterium]
MDHQTATRPAEAITWPAWAIIQGESMKYQLALLSVFAAAVGCKLPFTNNLPPAERIMHPGPGVDGPGPGVMMLGNPSGMPPFPAASSQVVFAGPDGMMVAWDVSMPGMFDSDPLIVPGRYNFPQGAIYRLKLTNIPGREGIELYPTLEIGPSLPRTDAYLAHNAIPVQFTEEDFDQVLTGNFVTKVIYLPDPEYQELAVAAGVETLVSTRLDPGVDPIVEADRRGAILAIVRIGNKDLQSGGEEELMGAGYGGEYGMSGGMIPAGYCAPGTAPDMMAGVTAPQYGMPISGTPIGLPGPPHVPLGIPAGLQKHTIRNHTMQRIPGPVEKIGIHVRQSPGFHYPKPPKRAFIHERARAPWHWFRQPFWSKTRSVPTDAAHGP